MTILYHGLARFEDAAELEEFRKQWFCRLNPGSMLLVDAHSCMGNRQMTPGWYPTRIKRKDEPQGGWEATNEGDPGHCSHSSTPQQS